MLMMSKKFFVFMVHRQTTKTIKNRDNVHLLNLSKLSNKSLPTFMLRLVLEPVNERTLTLTRWPLLTTSATLATRPSRRSSEMWTKPSHRFLQRKESLE